MKCAKYLFAVLWLGAAACGQNGIAIPLPPPNPKIPYPNPFKHIVLMIQENRTPDTLFQTLLTYPGIIPGRYDIASSGLAKVNGQDELVPLRQTALITDYDLGHSHPDFEIMWDNGKMDGANSNPDNCVPNSIDCQNGGAGEFLSYQYVQASDIEPYLQLASQYGWANYMFQTNQGASYVAHQILFTATSAATAENDSLGILVSGIPSQSPGGDYVGLSDTGCLAPVGEINTAISPQSAPLEFAFDNNPIGTFCFQHDSMATLLDASQLSWKYYAISSEDNPYPNDPTKLGYNPQGYMFTAPASIYDICMPDYTQNPPVCTGPENTNNIDLKPSDVLGDIKNCNLPAVSWVVPTGPNSDHAGEPDGDGGPSWIAAVVNAVGNDKTCEQGAGYWSDTALMVVWDDWGGWYDHVAPTILPGPQGDLELGFRVPFIVISAYTPKALVSNLHHEFGSIIRFMEGVFDIPEGALGFSDARADNDLANFFNFQMTPRTFQTIPAKYGPKRFLEEPRNARPPDDY
ncbi:MAG TPA: alkaline phosphatase family protein [Terriglobales bacterium]|jgi:phospholipase C|nr:alkaline phosphatase family protein [Terriglobales bacterium]